MPERQLRRSARVLLLWLGWCVVCMLLALSGQAQTKGSAPSAQPGGLLAQSWWRDPGGQATFEQARSQQFQPYQGIFSRGYSGSVDWLRLRIAASAQPVALLVSPPWLNELTLFDPAVGRAPQTVGDRYPVDANAWPGPGFSFELPAANVDRDVWLRVKSTSAHIVSLQLASAQQAPSLFMQRTVEPAVYLTLMAVMFVVLLASWWLQRDRVLAAWLLRHGAVSFYIAGYYGFPALWFSGWLAPSVLDRMFSISVLLVLPLSAIFDIELLRTYRPARLWFRALCALPWLGAALLLPFALGWERQALQAGVALLMLGTVVVFFVAASCKPPQDVQQLVAKRVLVAFYALAMGALFIGLATVLRLLPPAPWTLQLIIWHNLFTAGAMTVLLFVRSQRWARLNEQMRWELQRATERLQQEQQHSQEQSHFLHMLMHELKTPLSVVSLALGARRDREAKLGDAAQAVRDMKAILERCLQTDRLDATALQLQRQDVDMRALLGELAGAIEGLAGRMQLGCSVPAVVHTDRQLLVIVLTNLLHNAAAYSPAQTPVAVQMQSVPQAGAEGLRLTVSNLPGTSGWPDPQRLFDRYWRAPGATPFPGTGLGLHLAQKLAQSLGGELRYLPSPTHICLELWIPQRLR